MSSSAKIHPRNYTKQPTGGQMIDSLLKDIRYSWRVLLKRRTFSIVALVILALGIGANTAIFTLINAVILKPLPVNKPEELVLFNDTPSEGTRTSDGDLSPGRWDLFSYAAYRYFREHDSSFQELSAFRSGESRVSVRRTDLQSSEAERASGHLVSGNYFTVLGVNATQGRILTNEDDSAAAAPAVVVSYGYWKQKLNSDAQVVGKNLLINSTAFTIVGVMPEEFFGTRVRRSPDFWLPLAFQPQVELRKSYLEDKTVYWLNMIGRLKPGVPIEQAQASVNTGLQQFLTEERGASAQRRESPGDSKQLRYSCARWSRAFRPALILFASVAYVDGYRCTGTPDCLCQRG